MGIWSKLFGEPRRPRRRRRRARNLVELAEVPSEALTAVDRAQRAYQQFHSAEARVVDVVDIPDAPDAAWQLGRVIAIAYEPESPSRRKGTVYEHQFGDYGTVRFGKHKPRLLVSPDGRQLLIERDESDFRVTERGIVG